MRIKKNIMSNQICFGQRQWQTHQTMIIEPRKLSIRNQSTFWKVMKTLGLRTKRGQLKPLVSEGLLLCVSDVSYLRPVGCHEE